MRQCAYNVHSFHLLARRAGPQGRFYGRPGGRGPPMKNVAPCFGPASLDFHLNRPVVSLIQLQNTPVISLIQLHIVPPAPSWNCALIVPHLASARTAPAGPDWALTLAGLKRAGPENYRQNVPDLRSKGPGRAGP